MAPFVKARSQFQWCLYGCSLWHMLSCRAHSTVPHSLHTVHAYQFLSYTPSTRLLWIFCMKHQASLRHGNVLCFAGFLAMQAYPEEETVSTAAKEVALHWNLTWEWGLRQWYLILSLLCCFLSLARWMDPYTGKETAGGEMTGSDMQSSFSSARKETSSSCSFRLVTLAQHEYLLQSHWHLLVHYVGYPWAILHILVKCPHYDKEHLTSSWHAVQHSWWWSPQHV